MTRARRTPDALAARLSADAERLDVEPPRELAPRVLQAVREHPPVRTTPTSRATRDAHDVARSSGVRLAPRRLPTLLVGGALAAALLVALDPFTRTVAEPRGEVTSPVAAHTQAELFAVLTPPGLDDVLPLPPVAFDLSGRMSRLAESAGRRAGAMVDGLAWPLRKLGSSAGPR